MLIDYEYKSGNLILSYIDKTGNIKLVYKKWPSPTKFISCNDDDPDKNGKYVTWDGRAVKEVYTKYPNKYSIYDYIDKFPDEERNMLYDYHEPNIFFVDIENEILDEKPQPQLAKSKVLSISIVHKNKTLVLGIDPLTKKEIDSIQNDINTKYGAHFGRTWDFKYVKYKDEYEMLLNFFKVFVPKMPVITGWNFKEYDWVFLVNRARNIGIDPSIASFTGKLEKEKPKDLAHYVELPGHRVIIDYMEIFKKWDTSIKVKESMNLDFVADKVLGVKKVNYEGNLKILYETKFRDFIYYNAIDSILVQMIHEKSRLADILYSIATLSSITVNSAFSTLAVTEGFLRKELREQKNIVLVKNEHIDDMSSGVVGGWVKEPVRGLASWTVCFDFSSLYPTTMRQFNISADSYKGQKVKDKNYAIFNGHQVEIEEGDIITKNGAVFKNNNGVVTQKMTSIFADRKKYKNLMMQKHKEYEDVKHQIEELERELL